MSSYGVTVVATTLRGALSITAAIAEAGLYPGGMGGVSIIGTIIGCCIVNASPKKKVMSAWYKGLWWSAILSLIGFVAVTWWLMPADMHYQMIGAAVVGIIMTGLMVYITEYYTGTDFKPVKHIAEASTTGHGTNIIAGLGVSMKATAYPVLAVCAAIFVTYQFCGGLYGVAIAATSLLSLEGMVFARDAYGPISDIVGGFSGRSGIR